MRRRLLQLATIACAMAAVWFGYGTGQWHYLSVLALAPILWLSGRR
jgi:uncharacterized integral membrane protein